MRARHARAATLLRHAAGVAGGGRWLHIPGGRRGRGAGAAQMERAWQQPPPKGQAAPLRLGSDRSLLRTCQRPAPAQHCGSGLCFQPGMPLGPFFWPFLPQTWPLPQPPLHPRGAPLSPLYPAPFLPSSVPPLSVPTPAPVPAHTQPQAALSTMGAASCLRWTRGSCGASRGGSLRPASAASSCLASSPP